MSTTTSTTTPTSTSTSLHSATTTILTSTIAQGRLLWSTNQKDKCFAVFISSTQRAISLLQDTKDAVHLQKALDKAASRSNEPAKGCVILRKAFNSYLVHHRPPQPNPLEKVNRIKQAERLVSLDMNPRLQTLKTKSLQQAENAASKFGDEPNSDVVLKHVTLSKRVPSMNASEFAHSLFNSTSTSVSTTASSGSNIGSTTDSNIGDNSSYSFKEPDQPPPEVPTTTTTTTTLETLLSDTNIQLILSNKGLVSHKKFISLLSRCVMKTVRTQVEMYLNEILNTITTFIKIHSYNLYINYHCCLIMFELSFNSTSARKLILNEYQGIEILTGCILRFPNEKDETKMKMKMKMKMNEDTNESSTTTKLTFFDVHDVSLNALGLLASHDQKTKKEMGSRSNGNKEGDGLLACLHSIRVQFNVGDQGTILTMCVALDLLQSLTQEPSNAVRFVGNQEDDDKDDQENDDDQEENLKGIQCIITALTLFPGSDGVFRAISGIIINCCTILPSSSIYFVNDGVIELLSDALNNFPNNLFVQSLGLRALHVICGGGRINLKSKTLNQILSTVIEYGIEELCRTALNQFQNESGEDEIEILKWASRLIGIVTDWRHTIENKKEKRDKRRECKQQNEQQNEESYEHILKQNVTDRSETSSVLEHDAWEDILAISVVTDRTTDGNKTNRSISDMNDDVASSPASSGTSSGTSSTAGQAQTESENVNEEKAGKEEKMNSTNDATTAITSITATSRTSRNSISKRRSISAFTCPITQTTMIDPATTCDGMTYERDAIDRWLKDHNTSPLTGMVLDHKYLTPNYALRSAIEDWKQENEENGLDGDGDDDGVMDGDEEDTRTTRLDFMNRREDTSIHLYWFDPFAVEVMEEDDGVNSDDLTSAEYYALRGMYWYATLKIGENWCVDTSVGHQWIAVDDNQDEVGRWIASRSLPLVVMLPEK